MVSRPRLSEIIFGGLLEDRHGILVAGESRFLRKIEFRTTGDLREEVIAGYVGQALEKLEYFKKNWKELNRT